MKKIVFFVFLLVSLFSINANATYKNEVGHFFCGFDTEEEFNKWTTIDANNYCEGNNFWFWSGDTKAAFYAPGPNMNGDDWLISPAVKLEAGKTYAVKVKMNCDWNINLAFTMGKEASVEGQTIIIKDTEKYLDWYYLKFNVPSDIEGGDYFFGVHNTSNAWDGSLNLESFEVVEDNDGSLTLTIVNEQTQEPLDGVYVALSSETFEQDGKVTKEGGKCTFENLSPGTYNVFLENDGYFTVEDGKAEVVAKTANEVTMSIKERLVTLVKGIVVDDLNQPVVNAEIKLEGLNNYNTKSDENGEFKIEDVMRGDKYTMTITSMQKYTYTEEFEANEETKDFGNIQLKTLVPTPSNIATDNVETGMFISWMVPISEKKFIVDNNEPKGSYEYNSPYYVYVGNKFQEPMTVTQISWAIKNDYPTVDLYIFPINRNGSLGTKPVWVKKDVPSQTYNTEERTGWSVYDLEESVSVPYGCIVAIGHADGLTPVADYENTWASVAADQRDLDNGTGFREAPVSSLFIRAKGLTIASEFPEVPAQALICKSSAPKAAPMFAGADNSTSFKVYRLIDGEQETPDKWTEIGSNIKDFYFIDKELPSLSYRAFYVYAVKSIYDGGKESPVCFSQPIDHNMHGKFVVSVATNTAINLCEGAVVKIVNNKYPEYAYEAVVKGTKAVFDHVYKGYYTMDVTKRGYKPFHHDRVVLKKDENALDVNLELDPEAPFNIVLEQDEETTDCRLSWNNVEYMFDDFEDFEDFAVNPENKHGWTFYDGDKCSTYGVLKCQGSPYPNMHAPMAFQVMNPYKTKPVITDLVRPYSGEKMLVSVSVEQTDLRNDDYMFSPELNFDNDFVFSFMAASGFYAELGREEFMVGYTTDAATSENVKWLTEEPVTVGALWTPFTYIMPAEAKHVVIRCVSAQHMFFMIDDVMIGYDKPETFEMSSFNVSLDGEDYLTTDKTNCVLEDLDPGRHIAELQTIYQMYEGTQAYSDFKQLEFMVEERVPAGIESVSNEVVYTYNHESGMIVPSSSVREMRLYGSNGALCMVTTADAAMSVAGMQPGVYVLKVVTENNTTSTKIVVK